MTQATQQQLTELLKQEIGAISRLLQSLEHEYVALADRQTTSLEQVVQQKLNDIAQLEQISRQRENMMAQYHITPAELSTTSSPFENNETLNALWHELAALAQQCRHKNRINGSIVETASRHSREALNILQGLASGVTSGAGALYDQHGHTTATGSSRSLTQA